jgi:photosystem II stability/assembly factor-like uncharacterized protein
MRLDIQELGKQKSTWIMAVVICLFLTGHGAALEKTGYVNRDDLFSIFFADAQNGWSCGRWGTVLHTADGGKAWEVQKSGTQNTLSAIYFVDPSNGWAVGNSGTIIHTADGGKTWKNQNSPVPFYHMDVCFVSPLKGWVVSEKTHILYTSNGGKTWEVQFSDEDYILKSISFPDESHGWAAGEFGHLYHTDDGGISWKKLAGEAYIDENTGDLKGGPFLYDIAAVDDSSAWAVGIEGRVIMTRDAGATWNEIQTGAPNTQLFSVCTDRHKTLIIAGKGVCLSSENSGHTWRQAKFSPPIDYTWIYDVSSVGGGYFAACGEEGHIYVGNSGNFKRVR